MPKNNEKPVQTFRCGAISVSVWEREGKENSFFTANAQRSYKDGDDWKYSDSFGRDELLTAAKLLDMAHTWIMREERNRKSQEE